MAPWKCTLLLCMSIDTHICVAGDGEVPLVVDTWIKTFPWPAYSLDLGAAIASLILRILVIFAFILPFYTSVGAIVTEKELRLREVRTGLSTKIHEVEPPSVRVH